MSDRITAVRQVFLEALELDGLESQLQFAAERCDDDSSLRAELEKMLEAHHDPYGVLATAAGATEQNAWADGEFSQTIGPYRMREKIGEGGMGVVYVAEQTEPVQRKVALKVIKPGMDTKEVIARFEAERQALAFMEHPNIARVLDAGATESGRSYFVMELVRGIPITEYCDQVKATPQERLELFKTVCDAVQHAHQKGIIHRDLKPSNVLVTQIGAKPVVKVIDFGLAKATSGQSLTDKTVYTGFMQLMGTPVYMSPEQAGLSGLDIDTRSDVYSLGVLLFELLTGTTPLDRKQIRQQACEELYRRIREVEAPKPSARISTLKNAERSTIAQQRQVEPTSLRQLLKGDLDRVVLKALDKDRERRYETPKDLAADIDRFLEDKPVLAVPANPVYLARKYLRRHRVAILTVAMILMALMLATAFSTRQAIVATEATKKLATEKQKVENALAAAEASEKEAQAAKDDAIHAQRETEQLALARQRLLYTSDMRLAAQHWDSPNGSLRKIEELLTKWIPLNDSPDDWRDFTWRYQWTRLHKSAAVTIIGTTGATMSADGKLMTADQKGIREWDESGTLGTPKWKGDASTVVFSANGRWAAVTHEESTKLIEISTGLEKLEIPHRLCSFSASGNLVYGWTSGGDVYESWSLVTGTPERLEPVNTPNALPNNITGIHVADDGRSYLHRGVPYYAAVGAFLDGQTEPIVLRLRNSNHSCAWSPDGRMAATGSFTGVVRIRLRSESFRTDWAIGANCDAPGVIRFSPDGRTLAIGGGNGAIDLWDVSALHELAHELAEANEPSSTASGEAENDDQRTDAQLESSALQPKFIRTIKAHLHAVKSIDFSTDGKKITSFDAGGVAKLWDPERVDGRYEIANMAENLLDGRIGVAFEYSDEGIVVSEIDPPTHNPVRGTVEPGDRILSLTEERTGKTIDCSNLGAIDVIRRSLGPANSLVRLELTTDGNDRKEVLLRREKVDPRSFRVAFTPDCKTVAVGDMLLGNVSLNLETGTTKRYPTLGISVAISPPNGRLLAVAEWDQVTLWDLKRDQPFDKLPLWTEEEKRKLPKTNNPGGTIAFSPDGKYFAIGTGYSYGRSTFSKLRVWRVGKGGFEEIKGPDGPIFSQTQRLATLVFTPDNSRLIVGDSTGMVRVWRTSDWQLERTFDAGARVWGLAITPDGKTLATGGGGSTVLWDFQSGEKLRVLSMPEPMVLAFSPDGKTLVSGSRNHLVMLWDVNSGTQLRTFHAHEDGVCGAAFSPDGRTLATVGTEGVMRLWKASTFDEIESYPPTRESMLRLGILRNQEGRFEEAEAILRPLLKLQQDQRQLDQVDIAKTKAELTKSLTGQGRMPVISRQPESVEVRMGEEVTLSVGIGDEYPSDFQWFRNGLPIDGATKRELAFTMKSEEDTGSYHVTVVPAGEKDVLPVYSEWAHVTEPRPNSNSGLRWEVYRDIPESKLDGLTSAEKFPDQPDTTEIIDSFDIPRDSGAYFGGRLTGFLKVPKTGEYRFYLCSDDSSEFYLSEDESPENEKLIASESTWTTKPQEWSSLQDESISKPIHLERGKRYWLRVLFKENSGGDHLTVTWQLPGAPPPVDGSPPIPGHYLQHRLE